MRVVYFYRVRTTDTMKASLARVLWSQSTAEFFKELK